MELLAETADCKKYQIVIGQELTAQDIVESFLADQRKGIAEAAADHMQQLSALYTQKLEQAVTTVARLADCITETEGQEAETLYLQQQLILSMVRTIKDRLRELA
jgi:hypothetical protein